MLVHPHNNCSKAGWQLTGDFTKQALSVWCDLCKAQLEEIPEPAQEETKTSAVPTSASDDDEDTTSVSLPSFDFGNTENSSGGSFGGGEFGGGGSSSDW